MCVFEVWIHDHYIWLNPNFKFLYNKLFTLSIENFQISLYVSLKSSFFKLCKADNNLTFFLFLTSRGLFHAPTVFWAPTLCQTVWDAEATVGNKADVFPALTELVFWRTRTELSHRVAISNVQPFKLKLQLIKIKQKFSFSFTPATFQGPASHVWLKVQD